MPPKHSTARDHREAGTIAENENVLLPNEPAFTKQPLTWTNLFELTRLFHALSEEDQKKVNLRDWAHVASKIHNPADVYDIIAKNYKGLQRFDRIPSRVKAKFEETSTEDIPDLEGRIGYNLAIDCPRKETVVSVYFKAPSFCKPNELNRTYGADNFLFAKITDQLSSALNKSQKKRDIQKAFEDFIHTPIRIGCRLFFFILRKENMLWFVSTENSNWLSTKTFINGILDLKLNSGMTVAKWVARTTLVLSATQSTIDINPEDIRRVPDLYSDNLVISRELLGSVAERLGLSYIPSCIQGYIQNKRFVWRLGDPHEDKKYLIQLWDDQLGRSNNHVVIKFQVKKWDQLKRKFVSHEEPTVVRVHNCLAMGVRVPSEIMTDGAGIISREAARRICENLGRRYEVLPAAYQARIAFAKGLWILSPNNNPCDVTSWIEVRDSQWKAEPADNYHYHFNLCRISSSVSNANLGKQLLPLLASRGVTAETVCKFLKEYLESTISNLNTKDPVRLASVLNTDVPMMIRRKDILSRISNKEHDPFVYRKFKEDGLNLCVDPEYNESWEMTVDKLDKMSLNPFSAEEQVVSMLASGFEPRNRYIVDKIRKVKVDRIYHAIKFRIPISQSCFAYVVPDPTATLKEGEVFLQLSDFRDTCTGNKISTLIGPALISRSPCVAPIDVRKVEMVYSDILSDTYFDVLVCSVHGKASLLSYLSGGDYDGDMVTVIWDPSLVEEFENADMENYPRIDVEEYFRGVQAGTVHETLLGLYDNNSKHFVNEAQSMQIAGLFNPNDTGVYSSNHTTAEYVLGSDHPLTQKLGEVYVKCLDAAKAGLEMKSDKNTLLRSEFQNILGKVKHPNGNKVMSFDQHSAPLPKFLAGNPKYTRGGDAQFFHFERDGKSHMLDALLKTGYETLNKYKKVIDDKDCSTHKQRFRDRDYDLCQLFREQRKLYEFDRKVEGSQDIWIGVLRPLQRAIADILDGFGKSITKIQSLKEQDKIWESEYGAGTAGGRYTKASFFIQKKYSALSYEKAFNFQPEDEEIKRCKIDLDKFRSNINTYLEGLGPMGYALLKASCLAMCSNPEAFAPYDLAFRETCYLKAMFSRFRRSSNFNTANHFCAEPNEEMMSNRPPRCVTTESYYTTIVKLGVVRGRSTAQDKDEPV